LANDVIVLVSPGQEKKALEILRQIEKEADLKLRNKVAPNG